MKKFIAVVITVIVLMSLCGMQSFAFTIKLPTVTDLKILDDEPVSVKGLDKAAEARKEYIDYLKDEHGVDISEIEGFLAEEINKFYLADFDVELTLSDGSVVTMDVDEYYEIDRYTEITVSAYVTYDEYLALKENDADTVKINFECSVFSMVSGFSKDSSFTVDEDIVDCIIKSFKPTSTINYNLYELSDTLDLDGKKFSVTYADGTKKTLTAEYDAEEEIYVLGDEYLYIWFTEEKDEVEIQYIDEVYTHSVSWDKEFPYESIEITDYAFSGTEGLTSVTYVITDNKGKEKSFTVETTPALVEGTLYPEWHIIEVFDSCSVVLCGEEAYDYDSGEITGYEIYLAMGELYSESVILDYNGEDSRTFLEKIEDIIATILSFFFVWFFPDQIL